MILRDDIAHHRKFLLAGQLIGGPAGASRALAMWVAAIGYARAGLTGGMVHDAFLDKFLLDSEPKIVAKALCSKRVTLFHRVRGGYIVHDFDEHNGSAAKLRHQRELAKERKRRQRAKPPVENLLKSVTDPDVTDDVTHLSRRDSRARVKEKEKEVRTETASRGSPVPPVQVPKREQRPSGRQTHGAELSEAERFALAHAPAADGNHAVLVRLTHAVMDATGQTDPTSPDLVEAVKVAAATKAIHYPPDVLTRALESAGAQRAVHAVTTGPLADLAGAVRTALRAGVLPQTLRTLQTTRRARAR